MLLKYAILTRLSMQGQKCSKKIQEISTCYIGANYGKWLLYKEKI